MALGVYNSAAFITAAGVAVAPNADVEVRRESDSGLASIYSDRAGATPITQPGFQADSLGRFTFYAAGLSGGYQVTVTEGAESQIVRNVAIGTAAELDADPFWAGVWAAAAAAAARLALGFAAIAAKGDSWWGSAADTIVKLPVGANGTVPMARSVASAGVAWVAALNKAIYGLTYESGTDATNDIDIHAGGAMSSNDAYWMTLPSVLGKQSDVAWAVGGTHGSPVGGLDTGAVGNNDYYIWLIARSDTGVVDVLFSLSSTTPILPTNYDVNRLIGWFKRVGGTIVAFHTYETEGGGIEFLWDTPTLDVNLVNTLTTSEREDAVKVPLNFAVIAMLNVLVTDGAVGYAAWIYCPDQNTAAPSSTAAPLYTVGSTNAAGTDAALIRVRTSSTGTIASRGTSATADLYDVSTMGFNWARRN